MVSFVLGAVWRDLRRGGAAAGVGVLLSGLAACLTGGTLAGLTALDRLTAAWRADLRVVAMLRQPLAQPDGPQSVVAAARALGGVAAVRYVGPEEALADLRHYLVGAGDGVDRLPANAVPARLVITPAATLRAVALRGLVEALGRLSGVEDVEAAVGWVEPAERLERGLRLGGFALGALLGLGAVLAVAGATRAARRGRAEEIAILRLAGVREVVIAAPFLLQALAQGVVGAALGVGVLLLVSEAGPAWAGGWLQAVAGLAPLPPLSGSLSAAFLGGGLCVGLFGALGGGRP